MKEILLVDKPKGITSFDVIRGLRKKLGVRKMGHAGTLDPLATGLIIIGVGTGTKKLTKYLKLPKTYEAGILCGASTVTDDLEGDVEKTIGVKHDEVLAKEILGGLIGKIPLQTPLYSALKVDGKPLYKYAREGIDVTPPTRDMEIIKIEFISSEPIFFGVERGKIHLYKKEHAGQLINLRISVGSGTYIRSLAREIGKRMGVPATLASLRRTSIGAFTIDDALPLSEINGG